VVLSFGIPFALVPLLRLTSDRALMGGAANRPTVRWALTGVVLLVTGLNLALIALTVAGR